MPVLIIAFGVAFVKEDKTQVRLITHHSITSGTFDYFVDGGRSRNGVDYSFEIDGEKYTGRCVCFAIKTSKGYFLTDHHFPVAYQIGDTDNNKMLISPEDFETFHMEFPDSLSWIKPYLNNY